MTSEELLRHYYDDAGKKEQLLKTLYEKNRGMILAAAREIASAFHCIERNEAGQYTAYTKQILAELNEEGTVEFFRVLEEGKYDEARAQFSTYIYPFLKGVMRRWMEANLGVLSLDAEDMDMLRTVQREYYGEGLEEAAIMSAHDLTETELWRYLTYNTHVISIYDLIPQDAYGSGEAFDPYDYLNPQLSENTVPWTVYRKICYEHLKELFLSLPEKDRKILGESTGLFGCTRKSLEKTALEEMLTVDGVIKARRAAVLKLKKIVPGSELQRWRRIYHTVMYTSP